MRLSKKEMERASKITDINITINPVEMMTTDYMKYCMESNDNLLTFDQYKLKTKFEIYLK